ncbi:DUF4307 domain-containing protein [Actinocatenispora sera]|jgi:hypothetical protein|uniref:DUF4307 domain-containing protein n=1 Tax=Actinocatenispora sera TaxID=390989 RepID=UPI000A05AD9C|nr:DUF4307 domain-containing protein [Actinocatenispora sera]
MMEPLSLGRRYSILADASDNTARTSIVTSIRSGVTTPTFPPGRYGRRRERRATPRWVLPVLITGVVVAGLAVSVGYYQQYGESEYQAQVVRSRVVSSSTVAMTLRITRPDDEATSCTVRSRAYDGAEVGRATVTLPAGAADDTVGCSLHTSRMAYTAEVVGCGPAH